MTEKITSLQNPKIKHIAKLQQKSSERRKQNLIVIEGVREVRLAIKAGFNISALFICTEIADPDVCNKLGMQKDFVELSVHVYQKLAYRGSTEGVIALVEPRYQELSELKLRDNPLIIILESVEKPGNLGAILRTADAANVDAVIICDPLTDIYNPNAIRSSIGCVFTNQVVTCTSDEAIQWLQQNKISSFAAALTATDAYHKADLTGPVAIIMGTESNGLTEKWLNITDKQVIIPMSGEIDSLNVSTATAILVFEAMRQRNFYT